MGWVSVIGSVVINCSSVVSFLLGSKVITIHVLISQTSGKLAHHHAFMLTRSLCSHISDCMICHGMAHMAVTAIVEISTIAPIRNRLACINTHAKINQTNFFLIISFAQSLSIMDFITIYKNKNHRV